MAPVTAIRLDGKTTRDEIFADLTERVQKLKEAGITPGPVSYTHLTLPTIYSV